MKKILFSTFIIEASLSGLSVFADTDINIPFSPVVSKVSVMTEEDAANPSSKYKTTEARADILIQERINALNANVRVIAADKTLTSEQKASLTAKLSSNITGLVALKASIASSSDATSTKNLINSIYTNFRIYGVVIPQVRLEKRIYDLQNHSLKLSDTFLKVQAKIDEYKMKGKDVTIWQKNLDDSKIIVANDTTALAGLFAKISVLKPADYGTTSKNVIESTNAGLKAIAKDFNSIKKNLHKPNTIDKSERKVKDGKEEHSPLFGTSWVWTSMTVEGVTTMAPTGGKFVLSFGEDNRLTNSTDCNTLNGSYKIASGNKFMLSSLVSTKMFCEGSRQSEYEAQLSKTSSYKLEGANLILVNASGTMVFVKK